MIKVQNTKIAEIEKDILELEDDILNCTQTIEAKVTYLQSQIDADHTLILGLDFKYSAQILSIFN